MTDPLTAAINLSQIGIFVFPCKPNEKVPATPRGCLDATVDIDQIERWFRPHPNYNLAVATGKKSGLVVFDIDGPEGEAALRRLEGQYGELPATWETITGNGRHIGFEYPNRPVRNSVGKVAPGIDVRSDHGYCLVPPSRHPCGRFYEWSVDCGEEIATAPSWLIDLAAPPGDATAARLPADWCDLIAAGVAEGARNDSIAKLAGHLLRRHIDPMVALELLLAWNQARCAPPLPAADVERTVGSIATLELRRRKRSGT